MQNTLMCYTKVITIEIYLVYLPSMLIDDIHTVVLVLLLSHLLRQKPSSC